MNVQIAQARIRPEHVPHVRAAVAKVFAAIESAQFEDVGFAWLVLADGETFVVVVRAEKGTRNPIAARPAGPGRDRLLPPVLKPASPQADDRLLDELRPVAFAIA